MVVPWRDDIVEALNVLGGSGTYQEIYAEVAARRDHLPPTWQEIIRRSIQSASSDSNGYRSSGGDLFSAPQGIGRGVWALRTLSTSSSSAVATNPLSAQGYALDSRVKDAIERHAVDAAVEYYWSHGATEIRELGKPYDLWVHQSGEEVHVEVKGSTRKLDTVLLTVNEVEHAREFARTDLFVVDRIRLITDLAGAISTEGGRERRWSRWTPRDQDLSAKTFSYVLPELSSGS